MRYLKNIPAPAVLILLALLGGACRPSEPEGEPTPSTSETAPPTAAPAPPPPPPPA